MVPRFDRQRQRRVDALERAPQCLRERLRIAPRPDDEPRRLVRRLQNRDEQRRLRRLRETAVLAVLDDAHDLDAPPAAQLEMTAERVGRRTEQPVREFLIDDRHRGRRRVVVSRESPARQPPRSGGPEVVLRHFVVDRRRDLVHRTQVGRFVPEHAHRAPAGPERRLIDRAGGLDAGNGGHRLEHALLHRRHRVAEISVGILRIFLERSVLESLLIAKLDATQIQHRILHRDGDALAASRLLALQQRRENARNDMDARARVANLRAGDERHAVDLTGR